MHREEREFSIILHLGASFDESYEGDEDGFSWLKERFDGDLKPRLLRAVFNVLQVGSALRGASRTSRARPRSRPGDQRRAHAFRQRLKLPLPSPGCVP